MAKYHLVLSSSDLWRMASLILVTSFLPLYSPCLKLTLAVTLYHPACPSNFLYCSLSRSYFCTFSCALSLFSCSFLAWNSASCLRPKLTRSLLSFHSFCWVHSSLRFSTLAGSAPFPLLHESFWWSRPTRSRWSRFRQKGTWRQPGASCKTALWNWSYWHRAVLD